MLDTLAEFGGCCFSLHPGSFRCIREAESKDFNGFALIFSVSRTNARARTLPTARQRREFPVGREFRASPCGGCERTHAPLSSCRRRGKLRPTDLKSG
jgi:hypothetical protein